LFSFIHVFLVDCDYFLEVRIVHQLSVSSTCLNLAFFDHNQAVSQVKEINSVRHENTCLVPQ